MKPAPGIPDDDIEGDHFMDCPACGVRFDMRDPGEMVDHIHDGAPGIIWLAHGESFEQPVPE